MEQAIFLVAGTSSRFDGIVPHKCLLQLNGQTLLERQILQAATYGVKRFIFGLGAQADAVSDEALRVLAKVPHEACLFIRNWEFSSTPSWTTLWLCMMHAYPCDTLVFEGDVVLNALPRLPQGRRLHSQWLAVENYRGDGSFVYQVQGGEIMDQVYLDGAASTEELKKSGGVFALIWKDALEIVSKGRREYDLLDEYLVTRQPYTWTIDAEDWWELDTVEDFLQAKAALSEAEPVQYRPDPALL